MNNEQPEALRLADDLERNALPTYIVEEAAAELRRLHDLLGKANALNRIRAARIKELEGVNAMLLEALEHFHDYGYDREMGFAAITAAKESK